LPIGVAAAMTQGPLVAWIAAFSFQVALALAERVPGLQRSPRALADGTQRLDGHYRTVLWGHTLLQAGVMSVALYQIASFSIFAGVGSSALAVLALGFAMGTVSGAQGITYAHELGHSKRTSDKVLAWLLMGSVGYAHFMVEHYRGHHPKAATSADPASARRGESLWQFLPRTLQGSLVSAWRLESERIIQMRSDWSHSPLLWATVGQGVFVALLTAAFGIWALLFWCVQAAYAVYLLETINYIEHYGLERKTPTSGWKPRPEPFGVNHAWNADHTLTNLFIANLQRHSDHHMHAWKPYPTLEPLAGPQLPTGYAGCLFVAAWPSRWFALMHPRLDALAKQEQASKAAPAAA
jgi:alkane 1-monooxygenase